MRKIILLLVALPVLTHASNACYIDGKTVFQKEPCPIQEAQNVSQRVRDAEAYRKYEARRLKAHEEAKAESQRQMEAMARARHEASSAGQMEKMRKQQRHAEIMRDHHRREVNNKLDDISGQIKYGW